jgi:hypothetical protein
LQKGKLLHHIIGENQLIPMMSKGDVAFSSVERLCDNILASLNDEAVNTSLDEVLSLFRSTGIFLYVCLVAAVSRRQINLSSAAEETNQSPKNMYRLYMQWGWTGGRLPYMCMTYNTFSPGVWEEG